MGRPLNKVRKKLVAHRLDPKLLDLLKQKAEAEHRTYSAAVEECIRAYFEGSTDSSPRRDVFYAHATQAAKRIGIDTDELLIRAVLVYEQVVNDEGFREKYRHLLHR